MATLGDLQTRQTEIRSRLQEIDTEAAGERFTDTQTQEWNALNDELEANRAHIEELEARQARIDDLVRAGSVESEQPVRYSRGVKKSRVPDDPGDLMAYRQTTNSIDELNDAYKEGALRLNERMVPAAHDADREGSQERIERLVRHVDSQDDPVLSRRIIATSSPVYQRAFGKYIQNLHRTPEEERALSLTSGEGGYAVPVTLDPTIILTSAGRINPIRNLARIETITGTVWNGISSTGIVAGYAAEAVEASDNAPAIVQPTVTVDKAFAFVPMSIEITQDWAGVQSEMAMLFGEAKEDVESTKFLTGLGHGSNEPQGLLVGATAVVVTATTAVIAAADIYSMENALSPRPRTRGQWVGNKAFYQKVRQFDPTGGGANMWVQLAYSDPATLIGYPAHEWSAYAAIASGATVATFGDWTKFLIVDRVGMDVELIPHLFSTVAGRPTGQRGLYAYWRNSSAVLTPGLLANSAFVSLKVL